MKPGREASKQNPALEPFGALVGNWTTIGKHPMVPGKTFHGRVSFEWMEGGAFLLMHTSTEEPEIPTGIAVFGSDDSSGECYMVYFDERNVSRLYRTSFRDGVWKWWRDAKDLSQRFTATVSEDGNRIVASGELSKDGGPWEGDLALTYTRAK